MHKLLSLIRELTAVPTVSGYEKSGMNTLADAAVKYTGIRNPHMRILPSGSVIFGIQSKDPDAKTLVFDAHADTIGFTVTEHCGNGFVKVSAIGGIDSGILPASEAELYGKRTLRAFFTSVPPHLASSDKKTPLSELMLDTGLSDGELSELCPIGTPGGFHAPVTLLANNRIASKSLDDKLCIAAICHALKLINESVTDVINVYAHLSVGEEKSMRGASTLAENFRADGCVVLDVNFAKEQSSYPGEYIPIDGGAGLSLSASTNRAFTDAIYQSAQKHGVKCSRIVEMQSTGTNANIMGRMSTGIQTAVLSLPLKYTHTSVACASLDDVISCAKLLKCFAADCAKKFPRLSETVHKGGAL